MEAINQNSKNNLIFKMLQQSSYSLLVIMNIFLKKAIYIDNKNSVWWYLQRPIAYNELSTLENCRDQS